MHACMLASLPIIRVFIGGTISLRIAGRSGEAWHGGLVIFPVTTLPTRFPSLEKSKAQIHDLTTAMKLSLTYSEQWDKSKCPDYWGGLISGVNLYYKAYFGTFQSGQNTHFRGPD